MLVNVVASINKEEKDDEQYNFRNSKAKVEGKGFKIKRSTEKN